MRRVVQDEKRAINRPRKAQGHINLNDWYFLFLFMIGQSSLQADQPKILIVEVEASRR
jgi:hypothetical protein